MSWCCFIAAAENRAESIKVDWNVSRLLNPSLMPESTDTSLDIWRYLNDPGELLLGCWAELESLEAWNWYCVVLVPSNVNDEAVQSDVFINLTNLSRQWSRALGAVDWWSTYWTYLTMPGLISVVASTGLTSNTLCSCFSLSITPEMLDWLKVLAVVQWSGVRLEAAWFLKDIRIHIWCLLSGYECKISFHCSLSVLVCSLWVKRCIILSVIT